MKMRAPTFERWSIARQVCFGLALCVLCCMYARVRVCVECVNGCVYVCVFGAHHKLLGRVCSQAHLSTCLD